MFYVYVIKSGSKIYIGHTDNLERRLSEHNLQKSRSTKTSLNWVLIYNEVYQTRALAIKREIFLKSGDGRRVLRLKNVI